MSKGRKAGSCAFKAWNTTSDASSTKANATTTGANATCDLSAALEAATTEVTTATMESAALEAAATTTAVPSGPCYGCERYGCDANYQINYSSYFHISTFGRALPDSHCASVGYYGVSKESLLPPSFEIEDWCLKRDYTTHEEQKTIPLRRRFPSHLTIAKRYYVNGRGSH